MFSKRKNCISLHHFSMKKWYKRQIYSLFLPINKFNMTRIHKLYDLISLLVAFSWACLHISMHCGSHHPGSLCVLGTKVANCRGLGYKDKSKSQILHINEQNWHLMFWWLFAKQSEARFKMLVNKHGFGQYSRAQNERSARICSWFGMKYQIIIPFCWKH